MTQPPPGICVCRAALAHLPWSWALMSMYKGCACIQGLWYPSVQVSACIVCSVCVGVQGRIARCSAQLPPGWWIVESGCFAHFYWLSSQSPFLHEERVSGWRGPVLGVRVSVLCLVIQYLGLSRSPILLIESFCFRCKGRLVPGRWARQAWGHHAFKGTMPGPLSSL